MVKRLGSEVDHLAASSAEVNNEFSGATPHIRLQSVDRISYAFTFDYIPSN